MGLTSTTGWIAAVLLFCNFATCLVTPWAQKRFKECDSTGCHETTLGKYHKPFVVLSIIAVIVHIIVSIF